MTQSEKIAWAVEQTIKAVAPAEPDKTCDLCGKQTEPELIRRIGELDVCSCCIDHEN